MKKTILLLLVAVMLVSTLAGCRFNNDDKTETTSTAAETSSSAQENLVPLRNLPNKKYDTNIIFLMRGHSGNQTDIFVEPNSVNNVEQLAWERNDYVQETYGLEFELVTSSAYDGDGEINEILAGERFDIVVPHGRAASTYVQNYCAIDLYQLPYLNLTYDWWQQKVVENFTINGKLFYVTGDIAHTGIFSSYCFWYNRDMINDIDGAITPYQYVKQNNWNWTTFTTLAKQTVIDLDGGGASLTSSVDHIAWWTHTGGGPNCTFYASNNVILKTNEDGNPYFSFATESAYNAMKNFFDLMKSDGFCMDTVANQGILSRDASLEGRQAFVDTTIGEIVIIYAKTDLDYGIVPFPKVDETMDHYTSHTSGSYNMFLVPFTAGNFEAVAVTLEALSQESHKTVAPAYYDYASIRGSRDEENYEMVLLIDKSRFYDFGYFWSQFGKFSSFIKDLAESGSADTFYSTYNSLIQSGEAQQRLDEFAELFA